MKRAIESDGNAGSAKGSSTSLTEQAYRQIEEMIVTLELKPGQLLSEAELMESLQIGRTPIREALQRLAFEGLVVIMPRRGVLVSEINHSRQLALLDLRRVVERLIMSSAAAKATVAEREVFARLADDLGRAAKEGDGVAFMRLDLEFNRLTVKTCRNEYAARTMQLVQGLARRFWFQHYQQALDLKRCALLHQAVARAIADGQVEAAGEASDALIDYMAEFTRASI
ncbi:GntR family transcriptional regulator [Rhodobacteraceae bacterium NNCM2]|nr:GntR family transcriptional regulator [Coraliihabitans acroporae]